MTRDTPIFNVVIKSGRVSLRKVAPGRPGYATARKKCVLRQRDAIELFQRLKAADDGRDGVYSFQFLESAKTFAMLVLDWAGQRVQGNLDRIQAYDGTTDSSDG